MGCEVRDRTWVCRVTDARGPSKWKDNQQTMGNAKWKPESWGWGEVPEIWELSLELKP